MFLFLVQVAAQVPTQPDAISHNLINLFITSALGIVILALGFLIHRFVRGIDRLEDLMPEMQAVQRVHTLLLGQHEDRLSAHDDKITYLLAGSETYGGQERRSTPREPSPANSGAHKVATLIDAAKRSK